VRTGFRDVDKHMTVVHRRTVRAPRARTRRALLAFLAALVVGVPPAASADPEPPPFVVSGVIELPAGVKIDDASPLVVRIADPSGQIPLGDMVTVGADGRFSLVTPNVRGSWGLSVSDPAERVVSGWYRDEQHGLGLPSQAALFAADRANIHVRTQAAAQVRGRVSAPAWCGCEGQVRQGSVDVIARGVSQPGMPIHAETAATAKNGQVDFVFHGLVRGATYIIEASPGPDGRPSYALSSGVYAGTSELVSGYLAMGSTVTAPAELGTLVLPPVENRRLRPSVATLDIGLSEIGVTSEPRVYWSSDASTKTRQWLRDGKPIAGATGARYTATKRDLGARLSLRVTESRPGYRTGTDTSMQSTQVQPQTFVYRVLPKIRGKKIKGKVLRVTAGRRFPQGGTVRYQWFRDGVKIKGATHARYRVRTKDAFGQVTAGVRVIRPYSSRAWQMSSNAR